MEKEQQDKINEQRRNDKEAGRGGAKDLQVRHPACRTGCRNDHICWRQTRAWHVHSGAAVRSFRRGVNRAQSCAGSCTPPAPIQSDLDSGGKRPPGSEATPFCKAGWDSLHLLPPLLPGSLTRCQIRVQTGFVPHSARADRDAWCTPPAPPFSTYVAYQHLSCSPCGCTADDSPGGKDRAVEEQGGHGG